MFNPDRHSPILRLVPETDTLSELTEASRALQAASLRYTEALSAHRLRLLRAQPIRISAAEAVTNNDFWDQRHRTMAGPEPLVARQNGTVETI